MLDNPREANPEVLQRLVDQLPAMVAYWDSDCRNVVANATYYEWFGFRAEQMPGIHISKVLGESVYSLNLPFILSVLRGEKQLFERTLIDTAGRVRHTQASYIPDISDGRVVGFFVLVTDITGRVQAERSANRAVEQYRSLARSLPGAFVMLFDSQLNYLIAEGSGLKDFGLSSGAIEGRTLWQVLPNQAEELQQYYRKALEGEITQWSRSVRGRVYSLTAAPVTGVSDEIIAGMVIGRDITDQRRLEVTRAALQKLALAAAHRATLAEIVELVAQSTLELFDADYAGVLRFDANEIRILSLQPPQSNVGEILTATDDTAAARVARFGTAQLMTNQASENGTGILSDLKLKSSAAAPIWVGSNLWGSIGVGLRREFDDEDATIETLQDFADLVSLAISNNKAWDELDHQARQDSLTSLPNRRVFEEQLENDCKRALREGVPVAVVIIDLDHFKSINDTHGHQVGDTVLIEAASRLRANCRSDELISRLGGEEFAAVLFNSQPTELEAVCERLRRSISDTPFAQGIQLTASVGAASRTGVTEPTTLIRLADNALYMAKNAGRNRVSWDS